VHAAPYTPASDTQVLAELPAGARYTDLAARGVASDRLDVALPLAQFYIRQSRTSGDLRYLGYADAVMAPWLQHRPPVPEMLVLHATVQQSRHEFAAALSTLDLALRAKPGDPQALLTQATILRVLGRYPEAEAACARFAAKVDPGLGALCVQSLRALTGQSSAAYATLAALPTPGWTAGERSWLYSELGEMAARLGRNAESEQWFAKDLAMAPEDFYARAAYADLLLHEGRPQQVLQLLENQQSIEPLLLRIAIAQRQLDDPHLDESRARLADAFAVELERGEAVHRREQARFLLEVQQQPWQALAAAQANWHTQREPQDAEVLVAAAQAAGEPAAAADARAMLREAGITPAAETAR
jgi:predicted Zn-dependent protease